MSNLTVKGLLHALDVVSQPARVREGGMSYQIEGQLLEVCTCNTVCPCWVGVIPDGGSCDGVIAWQVEKGNINGVDVSGRTVAVIAHIPGVAVAGNWRVALYVDDKATEAQKNALLDAYSGKLGGALAGVAGLVGEVVGTESVSILANAQNGRGMLKIGDIVTADFEPVIGAHGEPTQLSHGLFSSVPGAPAYVGKSKHYKAKQSTLGINVDVQGLSTMQTAFRFEG